jgi:GNAT superfamily N-acetyltransferase
MATPIHPQAAAPPEGPDIRPFRWVPVRSLSPRHRPRVLAHLLALGERDRYLRFGHAASDAQIARYVDQIDFETDEIFGIFNRRLELVAMAHLAFLGSPGRSGRSGRSAEFGVSVAAGARGRGWGKRLFDRAVLHARNRGVDTLHVHALVENAVMLHIARDAGAQIDFDGSDAFARLTLPPEDLVSHVGAIVDDQFAELDYGMKLQARRVGAWLSILQADDEPPGSRAPGPGEQGIAKDPATPPPV